MSYFNYLPNTLYRVNSPGQVAVKNILVRAKVKDYLVERESAFLDYRIKDGETPESLAYRVYGKADYHWIILMFNEIHDIYTQWPMSDNELDSMMKKEYSDKGKVLHVDVSMMKVRSKNGAYVEFDRRNPHFDIGTVIEQITFKESAPWSPGPWQVGVNPLPEPDQVIAKGVVKEWDPNLYKLVVEPIGGLFRFTGIREEKPGNVDRRQLSPDIRFTNSRGQTVYCPLVRIVQDNRYGIHHFEDQNKNFVSPVSWINVPLVPLISPLGVVVPAGLPDSARLIESYAIGNVEGIIPTLTYGNISVVNNYQHESAVNENKRIIKMMRPKYIDSIIKDMRILMGR